MCRTCVIILLILCRLLCPRERVVPDPVTEPVTEEPVTEEPVTELKPEQEPVIEYYEL
jgi:hypothetical protein